MEFFREELEEINIGWMLWASITKRASGVKELMAIQCRLSR